MIKKPLLLFLALLLPVTIFLFLHFFGQNEFEIPVYYESSIEQVPTSCQIEYNFPYRVTNTSLNLDTTAVVFFVRGLSEEQLIESTFQLSRLVDEFGEAVPQILLVNQQTDEMVNAVKMTLLDSASYIIEKDCLFIAGDNQIVLVDGEKRIRGYYANATLKEVDRLILELKILFKDY